MIIIQTKKMFMNDKKNMHFLITVHRRGIVYLFKKIVDSN